MPQRDNYLLISNTCDDPWSQVLERVLSPLGSFQICKEKDILRFTLRQFCLIIIDAASVSDVPRLISRILAQAPNIKVIVATATPTWKQAREVFYAGATDYVRKLPNEYEILSVLKTALNLTPASKTGDEKGRSNE